MEEELDVRRLVGGAGRLRIGRLSSESGDGERCRIGRRCLGAGGVNA